MDDLLERMAGLAGTSAALSTIGNSVLDPRQSTGEFWGSLGGGAIGTGLGAIGATGAHSLLQERGYNKAANAISLLTALGVPITSMLLGKQLGVAIDPRQPDIVMDVAKKSR